MDNKVLNFLKRKEGEARKRYENEVRQCEGGDSSYMKYLDKLKVVEEIVKEVEALIAENTSEEKEYIPNVMDAIWDK